MRKVGTLIDWKSWVILLFNSSISAGLVGNTLFFRKDRRKKSSSVKSGHLVGHYPLEIKWYSKNSFNKAIIDYEYEFAISLAVTIVVKKKKKNSPIIRS